MLSLAYFGLFADCAGNFCLHTVLVGLT